MSFQNIGGNVNLFYEIHKMKYHQNVINPYFLVPNKLIILLWINTHAQIDDA